MSNGGYKHAATRQRYCARPEADASGTLAFPGLRNAAVSAAFWSTRKGTSSMCGETPKMTKSGRGIVIALCAVAISVIAIWLDLEFHWTAYSRFTDLISP